jgi:hypothetical protein
MWAAQSGSGYLFASDTIRKGDDYRTPVIPAALLSRNPSEFRDLSRMTQLLQIAKGSNLTVLAGFKTLDSGSKTLPE